ncbi:nucleolar RNA-binding protein, LYAR-like protein, implicated in rRNA processing [Schizosaccharomyces osmophilus]|uniref:Nucleolar RNA-binding protein, LYAR-like protein, implicated in rRNA processing n=1 Tax=Schizosaccharomyces osmophilus TaxID=2545709 RepID=A0AAE9W8P2_9SCHI|nr:nucleolar RNA-binding protein, LYAR-like protein, implicated in rRNA processing [Schizosaccharomyces osmophilus]WBW70881.1 nucleolar RNA-binding protein, LYAR-like protein, implicated in rRNA processing [Schizosaccharomyces osmophilus]
MVSFCCEVCQDIIKKPKLDQHRSRCQGAYFTCIDCNTTFQGTDYRSHSSCMTEAQRYQKGLYRPTKKELKKKNQENGTTNGNASTGKAKETPEESEKEQSSSPAKKRSTSPDDSGEEKGNKKKKSSSKDKKTSPIEQMLTLCEKDDNESLYKLVKKHNKNASKEETLEAKDVLKQLKVSKGANGVYMLKAGSTD